MDSNFPEWTKSSVGITTPLTLPDNKGLAEDNPNTGFGCEREAECLIPNCNERYVVPKQEKEYLAHLLKLHQIVIGELLNMLIRIENFAKNFVKPSRYVFFRSLFQVRLILYQTFHHIPNIGAINLKESLKKYKQMVKLAVIRQY